MLQHRVVALLVSYLVWSTSSAPIRREVPQEHSHEPILTSVRASLNLNNPNNIKDPVFALLGNAAAAAGAGKITNLDCLQQATADQAFSNAKAAGDVEAMTDALIFRALERNTGKVGLASVLCNERAVNPEIAALSQHQDPASKGAAATNKAITLELAKQISSIGGNPQDALKSGTFAPGNTNDNTGKGNTCDDANDPNGCIFTLKLLVEDATPEEIDAAVAGASSSSAIAEPPESVSDSSAGMKPYSAPVAPIILESLIVGRMTVAPSSAQAETTTDTSASAEVNLQSFTGALGNIPAPAVTASGRGFQVANNSDFVNLAAALGRSCDVQHTDCSNDANQGASFTVNDCDAQNTECHAAISQ